MKNSRIAAVFVLYHPDLKIIKVVKDLSDADYKVIVIVNGAKQSLLTKLKKIKKLVIITNDYNVGLASALNQGAEYALSVKYIDFIGLFDQDSRPDKDMLQCLAKEISTKKDSKLVCIGPKLVDIKKPNALYQSNLHDFDKGQYSIPTSGTLITRVGYKKVGPMLNDLFIDGIDHEWCFRAQSLGMKIAISNSITMLHNMGDKSFSLLGQYKPIHTNPIRHYYIIRNGIYLLKLNYIPLRWRILEFFKIIRRIFFYLCASQNSLKSLMLIIKGISNGFKSKLGPLYKEK